jgi:hypothetical protein
VSLGVKRLRKLREILEHRTLGTDLNKETLERRTLGTDLNKETLEHRTLGTFEQGNLRTPDTGHRFEQGNYRERSGGNHKVVVLYVVNFTFTVHTARVPAAHNHGQHYQCRAPYAAVHTLVLLMVGIMMPETF